MKAIAPRPIELAEAVIVRNALERALVGIVSKEMLEGVASLRVVGECECGCLSVYFSPVSSKQRRVADGIARFADGRRAELLVWADGESVAALEIVDHEGGGQLPLPDSVTSWHEEGLHEAKR
jgi:hypothetical protein